MYLDCSDSNILFLAEQLNKEPDSYVCKNKLSDDIWNSLSNNLKYDINCAINTFCPKADDNQKHNLQADIIASFALYGTSPDEYFEFEFYDKNHHGRLEYLCDKQRFELFRPFYDFDRYEQIRNKWNQYNNLKKFFKRECVHIFDGLITKDVTDFISRHEKFVLKPVRAYHGDGVRVIEKDKINTETLFEEVGNGEYILDELIEQNEFFKSFHKESVNTIRVPAINLDGKIKILHPQLHIGRGSSVADNDAVSIRANIDPVNGIVYSPGFDHYKEMFILHPDTGTQIVGARIPAWNELKLFVTEVMKELEGIAGYIGLDLAYTKKGWSIVEVNPFPQVYSQQLIDKKGFRKELEEIVAQKDNMVVASIR